MYIEQRLKNTKAYSSCANPGGYNTANPKFFIKIFFHPVYHLYIQHRDNFQYKKPKLIHILFV